MISSKNKIIHIMAMEKFLPPFIKFIEKHFDMDDHLFLFITSERYEYGLEPKPNILFMPSEKDIFETLPKLMQDSKKIIFHALNRQKVEYMLLYHKHLLKKSYWIMWGGDLYSPEKWGWAHHQIIKHMGHLITGNQGDYELAKKWYGATGERIDSFVYPTNLYKEIRINNHDDEYVHIQIGNSADPTNNHKEILDYLTVFKDENIKIYAPLSYAGPKDYVKDVIDYGQTIFNDKFIPQTEYIEYNEYLKLLGKIDIAIFHHDRQQAMGTTISLLGLGKKVYINKLSNVKTLLKNINVTTYDINKFSLANISKKSKQNNIANIKKNFSEKKLIEDLSKFLK